MQYIHIMPPFIPSATVSPPPRRVHILTVATKSDLYFPALLNSCFRNGAVSTRHDSQVVFHILGFGEEWHGYTWRSIKVLQYLNSASVGAQDLVCVVDGYDVVCMRNLNELSQTYTNICGNTGRIVVGHTHTWWWMDLIGRAWYGTAAGGITINAGTYVGPAAVVRDMIWDAWQGQSPQADDQIILTKYIQKNPNMFFVDTRGEIFWTICRTLCNIGHIVRPRIYVPGAPKPPPPFFLHGSGDTNLNEVLCLMGYDCYTVPYTRLISNFVHKFSAHIGAALGRLWGRMFSRFYVASAE
jgi:hypothetical protein